jgi:hypothetical protein
VVDQKIRDTEYATMPMNFRMTKEAMEYQERAPLDRTEPRLEAEMMEADNVMAAETRSTGCHYRHYDKFTGEWERRWIASPQCLPEHIHRDPEVKREGNDVTQAAFQSPYAQPGYEQLIYCRDNVNSVFGKEEGGHVKPPVQKALLGRGNIPELTAEQMHEAGMTIQQGTSFMQYGTPGRPTGSEYQGVGRQGDFNPYSEEIMGHADRYLITNGKRGHSLHASFFRDAEDCLQRGAVVRGFNDTQEQDPASVRAGRMVAELPEATSSPAAPQTFFNVYGEMVRAEQALEATAREYMDSEYSTEGDRGEAIVTSLLTNRWRQVHDDIVGYAAWIAIFRHDHEDHGGCKPDLTTIAPERQEQCLDEAYGQLVWHLEIPGFSGLLRAQEGWTARHASVAIQSRLSEHIRITDCERRHRRVEECQRRGRHRAPRVIQLSDPAEFVDPEGAYRGGLDEQGMAYRSRIGAYQRMRTIILKGAWLIDNEHKNDGGEKANGTESDEDMTDASAATGQGHRHQDSDNQGHDDGRWQESRRCPVGQSTNVEG